MQPLDAQKGEKHLCQKAAVAGILQHHFNLYESLSEQICEAFEVDYRVDSPRQCNEPRLNTNVACSVFGLFTSLPEDKKSLRCEYLERKYCRNCAT